MVKEGCYISGLEIDIVGDENMKKMYKVFISVILLLFIGLLGYSYFNVSGGEIDGVNEIASTSLVTVTKRRMLGNELNEYVLNEEQMEKMKNLIIETNFRRVLSSQVFFNDSDCYEIIAKDSNQGLWLVINSLGGEYISVSHQFKGKHLKIKNINWKETIEEIIALSIDSEEVVGSEGVKGYYFEPNVSMIEGTLITRMYYGPPNYGENPDTDAQQYPFILKLDEPIDVIALEDDIHNSDRFQVTEIQVVPNNKEETELVKQYINKRITIQGTLFEAIFGGHHTDVLIKVDKILD